MWHYMLALVLVFVSSAIPASADRDSRHKKAEFAFALSPISQEAVGEIDNFELSSGFTWIIEPCYGPMRVPALIEEFGRHARYGWISPSVVEDFLGLLPRVAAEMADGGFAFELEDGSKQYRSVSRVSPKSPAAVLKFGKERKFRHPGARATTLDDLFHTTNPYPEPAPKPRAVSNAISEGIFCSQSPAGDAYNDPDYSEVAWVGSRGVRGRQDCGAFVFSKADGSGMVMHRCLKQK